MLDELAHINTIDTSRMSEAIRGFPEQIEEAVKIGKEAVADLHINKKKMHTIVVCGLGGSAIGGDILKTLFSNQKIIIEVNRDYHLPAFVNHETTICTISYSGNTEETISCFEEALKKGCQIISVTSGGELQRLAQQNNMPLIKIPSGMAPRCAVGFVSIPMILLLEKITSTGSFDYQELIDVISELCSRYEPASKTSINIAKSIALKLKGKVPLVYGVTKITDVVARRLKTQFNENSKIIALWDVFPEMNHNEIVPFSGEGAPKLSLFYPIFMRDRNEHPRITQRIKITQSLLKKKEVEFSEIWTQGNSPIAKIFSSIHTGDWVSFYLAILQGVDPSPVLPIDLLKDELKKIEP